ncbi:MAG: site-specific tyrosine recombinase XerC [Pseudomonadales bacterium]|jgi:integrase/recombinase XerD|nr:site-specific tyrosine recombinase XerC [Pseudomonadales bacterium]
MKAPRDKRRANAGFNTEHHRRPIGAPQDLRGLFAAMRRYMEHRAILGATEQGLYNMEYKLRQFIAWADERGVTHPSQVSRAVIERYQRWLLHYRKKDGQPLSVSSRRTRIVPLRGFFRWLTRQGEIPANPASDIDLPRMIRRLPRHVLSAGEAERVLAQADLGSVAGVRDRAMMEVLYATGLRRMELVQLQVGDIDAERAVASVRMGKGQKDRFVPLGERALHWIEQYLDEVRPQLAWNAEEHTLFLTREGTPLDLHWLSELMGRYVDSAELGKHGSCHLWRHTMATLMLEGGADIRFVQAMLGHAEIGSTQIYTQVAIRQLARVHALTHPGVKRRARGGQAEQDEGGPQPNQKDAASELLDALAREADEDGEDGL